MGNKRRFHAAALFSCLTWFCYWALKDILQQGIYTDVGLFGDLALGIYKRFPFYGYQFLHVGGYSIPLLVKDYHGALPVYLTLPWIYALGNTALALHLAPIFLSAVSLALFYAVAWVYWGDRRACWAATFMLASSPAWIAASRLGLYTGTELVLWEMGSILCFLLWRRRGDFVYGLGGFCLLGMGLGSRLFFAWFPTALFLYALAWHRMFLKEFLSSPSRLAAALAAAGVGVLPIVVANILGHGMTIKFLASHILTSQGGYSNLQYGAHLLLRLRQLVSILNGSAWSGISSPNSWFPWFVLLALLCGARRARFPLTMAVLVFLQSPVTPSGLDPHHLLIILPLLCLASVAVLIPAREEVLGRKASLALAGLLAFSLVGDFKLLYAEQSYIHLHGGYEVDWNAMGDVLAWLRRGNVTRVGLGDTGMSDPLNYLSGRELDAEEIFWAPYLDDTFQRTLARLRERFRQERAGGYYLFRPPGRSWAPFYDVFSGEAAKAGRRVVLKRTFSSPDRTPIFDLYFVSKPAGGLE